MKETIVDAVRDILFGLMALTILYGLYDLVATNEANNHEARMGNIELLHGVKP